MKIITIGLVIVGTLLLRALPQACAEPQPKPLVPSGAKPIDGVLIEAVENYQNPKTSVLDFGLGIWPLDAYYNGFSLDIGYTRYFNKTYAWEIVHGDYVYTVDKGLTSELAQNYRVDPQQIERLSLALSSNFLYTFAYGKFILFKNNIRYFRSALLAGPDFILSNKAATVGLGAGWRYEVFVNPTYSWKIEVRDVFIFDSLGNNLIFILGTAYGF